MLKESGADIRQLRSYTKEESHIWKPMHESTVQDFASYNGYAFGTVGNIGNWPTGKEGTSQKIVHMNNFMLNNYRRLHACHVMATLPGSANIWDFSPAAGRNLYFFGRCRHKLTLRNVERQVHTLRISKMRCTRNLSHNWAGREFDNGYTAGHNDQSNVQNLFSVAGISKVNTKSVEELLWHNWIETQSLDDNSDDRGEHWLNPSTRAAVHPALRRHFKVTKSHTIRVGPGETVSISYSLPPKLIKYDTILNNACLKGDVGILMESWGDLVTLRRGAEGSNLDAAAPGDAAKRPINMDFDKDTLTTDAAPGVDFTSGTYEESRHSVVRDHGEWAVLSEWTIPMQQIVWKHSPTVKRHEYPSYKKSATSGVIYQTYAPQDADNIVDNPI